MTRKDNPAMDSLVCRLEQRGVRIAPPGTQREDARDSPARCLLSKAAERVKSFLGLNLNRSNFFRPPELPQKRDQHIIDFSSGTNITIRI